MTSTSNPMVDEPLHLDLEDFLVPARLLGQTIVGDHECALLHFGEAGRLYRPHGAYPKQVGRREPPVPSKDDALLVNQNRYEVAKGLDALGDVPDLTPRMCARITGIGRKRVGVTENRSSEGCWLDAIVRVVVRIRRMARRKEDLRVAILSLPFF